MQGLQKQDLVADQSILQSLCRLVERFQELIQMLLVFLINIDIKPNTDGIAGEGPAKNSGILCGGDDGITLPNMPSGMPSLRRSCLTAQTIHESSPALTLKNIYE